MIDFTDFAVFVGMMFLRIGVPALVIVALAYGLKRLDRRWEAEARAYQAKVAAEQPSEQPAIQPEAPAPQPARGRRPGKQPVTPQPLPFIPPQPASKEQRPGVYAGSGGAGTLGVPGTPGIVGNAAISASGKHCWDEKNCGESKRANCAAPTHADQPCWQARFNAEGHVPEECVSCDVFQRYPSM